MANTAELTLSSFLLARLAEDEATALLAAGPFHPVSRVLAECKAKRQIIADLTTLAARQPIDDWSPADSALVDTLRTLASIYSDHPDYDESWRP